VTVAAALVELGTVAQDATEALGVRANLIYSAPPEQIPAFPAIVMYYSGSTYDQYPFGQVATGIQFEQATITVQYFASASTLARAHPAVLAFCDAFRVLIAAHQTLANTVRQVRMTRATIGQLDYNGKDGYHGCEVTLECDLYHATTFTEA
jgi:hypothetical protein